MAIPYKVVAFLEQDTIDHIDRIAVEIGEKNDTHPTRSEAIAWLVRQHWKKTMVHSVKQHAQRSKGAH